MTACDHTDGPTNVLQEDFTVSGFQVSPSSLLFNDDDGIQDTLITFQVSARAGLLPDGYDMLAILSSSDTHIELASGTMHASVDDPELFTGTVSLEMRTIDIRNLIMYVVPVGPDNTIRTRSESNIKVRFTTEGRPIVHEIQHPEVVYIPTQEAGAYHFFVSARISHTVSNDYINQVRLQLFNQDGVPIFSSDMNDVDEEYGTVPGDSIYVQRFSIGPENNPDEYDIRIHAIDIARNQSDTLSSRLVISR